MFRPRRYGVKCMIENDGKVILIRNSYGKHGWTFPGGAVNRKETPVNAAIREVKEEVGINIKDIKKLGEYESTKEYKRDKVYCYHAKVNSLGFKINPDEVSTAEWFAISKIPEFRSSAVNKILGMYEQQRTNNPKV